MAGHEGAGYTEWRGGIYGRVKAHDQVKEGGVCWGFSMAREEGSAAAMVRRRERRRR
jgi:hypothetical protein